MMIKKLLLLMKDKDLQVEESNLIMIILNIWVNLIMKIPTMEPNLEEDISMIIINLIQMNHILEVLQNKMFHLLKKLMLFNRITYLTLTLDMSLKSMTDIILEKLTKLQTFLDLNLHLSALMSQLVVQVHLDSLEHRKMRI